MFREWFEQWGNANSGNRRESGHKGIPGFRGGSLPGPTGGAMSADWEELSIPERNAKFASLSKMERDALADPENSILKNQADILKGAGDRPTSGTPRSAIAERLKKIGDLVTLESAGLISKVANETDAELSKLGVDEDSRRALVMEMVDTMASQDYEAMSRTLGDHGSYHLEGDARMAQDLLRVIPGADTPRNNALVNMAAAFHDTGYMTPPSKIFMDGEHPHWSQMHFDANIRPMVEKALGPEFGKQLSGMIATHADTTIDYKDPAATAFRLSDNLALFHREKMPPVFRNVPDNISVLKNLGMGKVDVKTAQTQMISNINKAGLSKKVSGALRKSITELSGFTPKVALGMLAGDVHKVDWAGDHVSVSLYRNSQAKELQKTLDLGAKQFLKFSKAYGMDSSQLENTGFAELKSGNQTVLDMRVIGEALRSLLQTMVSG